MPTNPSRPAARTAPLDWAEFHARLERSNAAGVSAASRSDPAAILARRAAELARPPEVPEAPAEAVEVVAFQLADQVLAVEARYVRETVILRELTRLPGLPECVRGVVNIRSRIVAAMDLRPLLQLPATPAPEHEKLLVVDFEGTEFGLLTDRVLGLRALGGRLRQEVPGVNDKYLRGLAEDGTVVLSLAAVVPDLIVRDAPDA